MLVLGIVVAEDVGGDIHGRVGGELAQVAGADDLVVSVGPDFPIGVEHLVRGHARGAEVVHPLEVADLPAELRAFRALLLRPGLEDIDGRVSRAGIEERDLVEGAGDRLEQLGQRDFLVLDDEGEADGGPNGHTARLRSFLRFFFRSLRSSLACFSARP